MNSYFFTQSQRLLLTTIFALLVISAPAQAQTLMLRQPALSESYLAFVYGGDIWIADADGDNPRRLTSHPATESNPKFSPDGEWLAFSATYESNTDVYVISVEGGQARRLTWHPQADTVNGWSNDGRNILFASARAIRNGRSNQLYHVALEGGFPEKLMDAVAVEGSWAPDGRRIAYRPHWAAHAGSSGWRLHRGGATPPIWIIDTQTQEVEKVPHPRANETNPMWRSDMVYFVSDRDNNAANLFAYDTVSKAITQLTEETQWDIRAADIHNDRIIYEVGGRLKTYNLSNNRIADLQISINPDSPQTLPGWKDASSTIQNIELSPTAQRALITARGDVFTVPIDAGSTRNLTASGGVRENGAIWSPLGDKIAYISDAGSVHSIVVVDQTGRGEKEVYRLGETNYYSLLAWGKAGERLIYEDNHLHLFSLDLESREHTLIRTDMRRNGTALSISPDGKWLAYTQSLANHFSTIMVYEFASETSFQLNDGLSLTGSPTFSRDGQYLYFTASTNAGPLQVGLDMSTQERPLRNAIYAAVLASDGRSPLLPKSGDESPGDEDPDADEEESETPVTRIDLDAIERRLVALPIPERNYTDLSVSEDGSLYFIERRQPGVSNDLPASERQAIHLLNRFDFEDKEVSLVKDEIANYIMSADGKTLLLMGPDQSLLTADIADEIKPEALNTNDLKMFIDPRQEWRQIFDEVWRMEKQFFYAENMHGLDWQMVRGRYEELLPYVSTREDLNLLLVEMIAELQVGHNRIAGGDIHRETPVVIGLLGADLSVQNNAYRVDKIYTGEQWNPFLKAPLAAPGIGIAVGDYILEVNGIGLDAGSNIYALLAQTVGKQVTLLVNDSPETNGAHEIVVEPVASERALRQWSWIEDNRKYVEEQTGGRVGYVYLPDTGASGFTFFNRMFFSQIDKEAMIIDERRNGGGQAANYITDVLGRGYLGSWKDRDGLIFDTPGGALYGPKVMLVDQDAGSGGDFLPYAFKHQKIGTLIGKTTWGGLIGISANPALIDGGSLVVPFFRFFSTTGEWRIENEGISPDVEIDLEPDAVNRGVDTQLEAGIAEVMRQLEDYQAIKQSEAPPLPTVLGQ